MTDDPWRVLSSHQQGVAKRFIAEREAERAHLVVYLSGAHAYGFPSPDSDLDLKCVHVAPTQDLVGLEQPSEPSDRIEVVESVELDYGSNELAPVLRGIIKGNGNFVERMLGELALAADPGLLPGARERIRPLLSRRVAHHYRGFATSQRRAFEDKPTAKRALYVLRTAATGRHLMAHGEVVTDVARLEPFLPPEISELLEIKRNGERSELDPDHAQTWRTRLAAAIDAIDTAWATSVLPPEPSSAAIADTDAWLRDVRHARW